MVSPPRLDGQVDLASAAETGIRLCREGKWQRALDYLGAVANQEYSQELPSAYYSYLGLATAVVKKQHRAGARLCEVAIRRHPCEIDNYVNLVRLRLMTGESGQAWRALRRGLALAPEDPRLCELLEDEFSRRRPVMPFLRRGNPINVLLGRIRHRLREQSIDSYA